MTISSIQSLIQPSFEIVPCIAQLFFLKVILCSLCTLTIELLNIFNLMRSLIFNSRLPSIAHCQLKIHLWILIDIILHHDQISTHIEGNNFDAVERIKFTIYCLNTVSRCSAFSYQSFRLSPAIHMV